MDTKKAEELIDKFNKGILSPDEEAMLDGWYLRYKDEKVSITDENLQGRKSAVLGKLDGRYNKRLQIKLWPRILAAAAVAAIVLGVYFFNTSRRPDAGQGPGSTVYANDIAPGRNGATITLANGKVIQLSDVKSGVVIGEAVKYSDGSDVRTGSVGVRALTPAELQGADGKAQQLTAATARGQTYQFTLPDGTKVWLNADSKLEFPSKFGGVKQRIVRLDGEGYFEVEKDKARPFVVVTDKQEVEVLGTHFNINSYTDESSTKTTLLEGSVRVGLLSPPQGGGSIVLKPNQQSVLTDNNRLNVSAANTTEAVAWKEGYFRFYDEKIERIMKKLERWYDIEVVYEGKMTNEGFTGKVSRNKNISQVLMILEKTKGVHFKIDGRRVTVID